MIESWAAGLLRDRVIGAVTWAGTILGAGGLLLTYDQARRARLQASAAREAAQVAADRVRALEDRLRLADIGYAAARLETIKGLVNAGNPAAAQHVFGGLKRTVIETLTLLVTRPSLTDRIAGARQNLSRIELQLDRGAQGQASYGADKCAKALRGLSDFLIERQAGLTYREEGR